MEEASLHAAPVVAYLASIFRVRLLLFLNAVIENNDIPGHIIGGHGIWRLSSVDLLRSFTIIALHFNRER